MISINTDMNCIDTDIKPNKTAWIVHENAAGHNRRFVFLDRSHAQDHFRRIVAELRDAGYYNPQGFFTGGVRHNRHDDMHSDLYLLTNNDYVVIQQAALMT